MNEGDNSPTLMRATLRAPPSKWAIKGFFPESPCRVLSLVLSFASKESTPPLGAAAPPPAPESARQSPDDVSLAPSSLQGAFLVTTIMRFVLPCLFARTLSLPYQNPRSHIRERVNPP